MKSFPVCPSSSSAVEETEYLGLYSIKEVCLSGYLADGIIAVDWERPVWMKLVIKKENREHFTGNLPTKQQPGKKW